MGYALLWIENLTVSLLLVALGLACAGRLRRRWFRHGLWILVAMVPSLAYGGILVLLANLNLTSSHIRVVAGGVYAAISLTAAFVIGMLWLRIRGLRPVDEGPAPTVAGNWPRGRLAIALGVAVALHLTTFWNMNLAARQQSETLRGEAGALALSVAPPRVPDRDNAAMLYTQAFESVYRVDSVKTFAPEKWSVWTEPGQPRLDVADPDLRQYLQSHTATIALLHKAAATSGCYFEHDYHWPTIHTLLPEVQNMRSAARLLALDARVKAADGELRAALQDINAMFGISRHIHAEPWLVALIVSSHVEQEAAETLQQVLACTSASPDDLAVLRIEVRPSYQELFNRSMRFEEAGGLTMFCQVSSGKLGLRQLVYYCTAGLLRSPPPDESVFDHVLNSVYRVLLLAGDLADYRRRFEQLRELAAKPYYEARPLWESFDHGLSDNHVGPITGLTIPPVASSHATAAQADALRQAVRLGLAAEQYRLRNGRFPARLDDLTPAFIPVIPLDPFDGEPMKLKQTERGLVIYSVGPDTADNGGAPFDSTDRKGDIIFESPGE